MFTGLHAVVASTLLAALLGAAVGFHQGRTPAGDKPAEIHKRAEAKPALPDQPRGRTVTGHVLGPRGEPVKGAQVFLCPRFEDTALAKVAVAADGTFRLTFDPGRFPQGGDDEPWRDARLIATAPGSGPVWARLGDVAHAGWSARLADDTVAIDGTLTTLEGKPVARAEITLYRLEDWQSAEKLNEYLTAVSNNTRRPRPPFAWQGPIPGQQSRWKADGQGRYRITGLGCDRVVVLRIGGAGMAWTALSVVTRPGKVIRGRGNGRAEGTLVLLPARHVFALPPGRTIRGVVKDGATGKPVPGMRITLDGLVPGANSGPDGRFELRGVAKRERYTVYAFPTEKATLFINAEITLSGDAPGLADEEVEIKVRRGIPVRVKLIDKATGQPEVGDVYCMPVFPNSGLPANLSAHHMRLYRQADGTYQGAALHGPGAVVVRRSDKRYVPARANQKAFFKLDHMPNRDLGGPEDALWVAGYRIFAPMPLPVGQFQAVQFINPSKDTREISLTLELDPGQTRRLRFTDPAGARLVGVRWKEFPDGLWSDPLPGADTAVTGVGPGRARYRLLRHDGKKLAAAALVKMETPNPLTVALQPWASLGARLVGKDGKPLSFHRLVGLPDTIRTDAAGRFRADGLVAGVEYTVYVEAGAIVGRLPGPIRLKAGEVKDLGDTKLISGR